MREARLWHSAALAAHSPYSALWLAVAHRLSRSPVPLFAFSFHFAKLPTGVARYFAKWAFRSVHIFVVHSEPERGRYAAHFGLPLERFQLQRWGVHPSSVQIGNGAPPLAGSYICAIGKDGRDYRTLLHAIARLPHLLLAVVAHPRNLAGVTIPPNVKIFCNVSAELAMTILRHSLFLALPLETGQTSCGHITLVSAMFCRKAILATDSTGIVDYFPPDYPCPRIPPGDVSAWTKELSSLADDPDRRHASGVKGEDFAHRYCSHEVALEHTLALFAQAGFRIDRHG